MNHLLDAFDFEKINSATKYPSIPTYHEIKSGMLQPNLTAGVDFTGTVEFREKIDGENTRIVFLGDGKDVDFFIGSREEFLYAKDDRIIRDSITRNILAEAKRLAQVMTGLDGLMTLYFETYGGKTPNAKNYTNDRSQAVRLFDIVSMATDELNDVLEKPVEQISSWREHGRQHFITSTERNDFAAKYGIECAPLICTLPAEDMPMSLDEAYAFLSKYDKTIVGINAVGKSEGLVARTFDRKVIAKLRFEDYERTFKRLNKK